MRKNDDMPGFTPEAGGQSAQDAAETFLTEAVAAGLEPAGRGFPQRALKGENGAVILPLMTPAKQTTKGPGDLVSERLVDQLVFHPLKGKQIREAQARKRDEGSFIMSLMQVSSGQHGPVGAMLFDDLDGPDFMAAQVIVSVFINPGL
ncbi:hypothetical protein Geu3261_0269_002 [Komagataeibacter europaeus NBRC 3261]|uniref:Uncharacterized protein n=1 Tax=Komagataeibacter europaeus NBRC 3261 TaxID=1234669 RepID=A0A0D6Q4D9_KOMEU|nr:hypothetical protein [Komagataeibacter europaeus]GAN97830.1 hypothetical protein Geu3261_0269_002 [Komagataeibacter europaeus NBRC 3261]